MSHSHHFASAADAKTFLLAGKATVTLQSDVTGVHYTFKVRQATDRQTGELKQTWFVSLLSGPDNVSDYTYMGVIDDRGFRLTGKSKFAADSKPVRGFAFFLRHIEAGHLPPQMTIRHEGSCGRCGRPLTVPESIDRGIGPDCWEMMGL